VRIQKGPLIFGKNDLNQDVTRGGENIPRPGGSNFGEGGLTSDAKKVKGAPARRKQWHWQPKEILEKRGDILKKGEKSKLFQSAQSTVRRSSIN